MKKTFFISIIALSGSVHAATVLTFDQFSETLKAGLVYANDFNSNGGNLVDGGISFNGYFPLDNGTAKFGSATGYSTIPYKTDGITGTSFTVSFDVTALTTAAQYSTLAAFYSNQQHLGGLHQFARIHDW